MTPTLLPLYWSGRAGLVHFFWIWSAALLRRFGSSSPATVSLGNRAGKSLMRPTLTLILALAATAEVRAQQPLPNVPDGFKVELLLSAPEIEAPTALCVAPNGDVYFAEDPMDMRGPSNK